MKIIKSLYLKYKEQINYVIVGGLTTLVSLGTYYFCVLTILNPDNPFQLQLANIISWICCVTFAYFANRKYVFESENHNVFVEAVKFYGARITTLLIDMLSMAIMVSLIGISDKLAKIIVQFIVFILNYIFSKLFVFRKKDNSEKSN